MGKKKDLKVEAAMQALLRPKTAQAPEKRADALDRFNQTDAPAVEMIPIERLHPNPFQPRKHFDEEGLQELARSIEEKGFFGHLVVRPQPKKRRQFELAYGERRLRAAAIANVAMIPCEVRPDLQDEQMFELAMVENVQREDLNAAEEIEAIASYKDEFSLSLNELVSKLGKSKTWLSERLRVAEFPDILEAVRAGLAWTTGTELARVKYDHERAELLHLAIQGRITREDLIQFRKGNLTLAQLSGERTAQPEEEEEGIPTSEIKSAVTKEYKLPRPKTSLRHLTKSLSMLEQTEPKAHERREIADSLREVIERAQALLVKIG